MYKIEESTFYLIHKLSRSLSKGGQTFYYTKFKIGAAEHRVLSVLYGYGPLISAEVNKIAAMDKALISRTLSRLKTRKLARNEADPLDGRKRQWELTERGRSIMAQVQPLRKKRQRIIFATLTADEQKQLKDMVKRLLAASEDLHRKEVKELRAQKSSKSVKPTFSGARALTAAEEDTDADPTWA
ncbi:MAG TPA: MarR family winged helix-turn-helix transcriptional regulator [Bauldia sp.]|nr:MarR family winged helix-turn-helix transcriptional regulator [Bauldia sp.]